MVDVVDGARDPEEEDRQRGAQAARQLNGQLDRQQHSSLPELLVLSPIITWDPEPHTIYNSLNDVNNFRSKHFATEAKREELAEKNQIHRLKLTWAGTVE